MLFIAFSHKELSAVYHQGIIVSTGTETIAKEPKLAKLLRKLKLMPVSCNKKGPLVFLARL